MIYPKKTEKTFCIIVVVLILLFSVSCSSKTGDTQSSNVFKEDVLNSNAGDESDMDNIDYINHSFKYLENSYSLLMDASNSVRIAFVGGSVTDGYGATNGTQNGWPRLIVNELSQKFPASCTEIRKSIGGTGSLLAAFRYDTDLAKYAPDILFIEYAINDYYKGYSYDEVVRYSESIVRKAYANNPYMDIVYVLTFNTTTKTENYEQLKAHMDVANKYGLLCIKLSDKVYDHINSTGKQISDYIIDTVHPNDDGYRLYADFIKEAIFDDFPENGTAKAKRTKKALPEPMSNYMENATLITADKIDTSDSKGWGRVSEANYYAQSYITAKKPGSQFSFDFTGTDVGLYYLSNLRCGKISFRIDDRESMIVNAYLIDGKPSYFLVSDLPEGNHTVEITLLDDKVDNFEIWGLLVN